MLRAAVGCGTCFGGAHSAQLHHHIQNGKMSSSSCHVQERRRSFGVSVCEIYSSKVRVQIFAVSRLAVSV